jgi:hypothetical protein
MLSFVREMSSRTICSFESLMYLRWRLRRPFFDFGYAVLGALAEIIEGRYRPGVQRLIAGVESPAHVLDDLQCVLNESRVHRQW